MTLTKNGYFGYAGGGKNGAIVDLWAASRFMSPPQENSSPPSGTPDAGPVTTATTFGGPGAYTLTPPSVQDYYVRVQYGGFTYWSACPSGTILGGSSGGGSTGVFNIQLYGADPTGTRDSAAAAAAAEAAAEAAGGGVLYAPRGNYLFDSPVTISQSGITWEGDGDKATTFTMGASFGTPGVQRGILQYKGTATVPLVGCAIRDIGFDTTGNSQESSKNYNNAVYQVGVPMQHFTAERLYFKLNDFGQGILFDGLGGGGSVPSHDLTFQNIYAVNGAGTISCYNNAVKAGGGAGGLMYGIRVDNIHNWCTSSNLGDDRVAISGDNGDDPSGTELVETRDISISNVFVAIDSGAAGVVNGVKIDCGNYGLIHEVEISDVFYSNGAGTNITSNNPVVCELGTGNSRLWNITVDGVHAYQSSGVLMRVARYSGANGNSPRLTVRNVNLTYSIGTILMEVNCSTQPVGDETIFIEDCNLHSNVNNANGIVFYGGSLDQGFSGLINIKNVQIRGLSQGIGITNYRNEAGAQHTSGFTNFHITDCQLNSCALPVELLPNAGGSYPFSPTVTPAITAGNVTGMSITTGVVTVTTSSGSGGAYATNQYVTIAGVANGGGSGWTAANATFQLASGSYDTFTFNLSGPSGTPDVTAATITIYTVLTVRGTAGYNPKTPAATGFYGTGNTYYNSNGVDVTALVTNGIGALSCAVTGSGTISIPAVPASVATPTTTTTGSATLVAPASTAAPATIPINTPSSTIPTAGVAVVVHAANNYVFSYSSTDATHLYGCFLIGTGTTFPASVVLSTSDAITFSMIPTIAAAAPVTSVLIPANGGFTPTYASGAPTWVLQAD